MYSTSSSLRYSPPRVRRPLERQHVVLYEVVARAVPLARERTANAAVVDDAGDELGVRLRLVEPAHDAEPDLHVALLHETRNDGVQRALARRQHVRMSAFEREERPAVLQHEAGIRRHDAAAERRVQTLDQRDDVSLLVDRR